MADDRQRYLDDLPRLGADERFCFDCHPGVRCFNACCRDLDLVLSPYDVLRLRRGLGLSSRDFLHRWAEPLPVPPWQFPALRLVMQPAPDRPCPFVTGAGCSVYEHRPGACRIYPLGRAAERENDGVVHERFVLVREDHCRGFAAERRWSAKSWQLAQGLEPYNTFSDRYLALISRWGQRGEALSADQQNLVFATVYQLDTWGTQLAKADLLESWSVPPKRRAAIDRCEEERLRFAFEWLERRLWER